MKHRACLLVTYAAALALSACGESHGPRAPGPAGPTGGRTLTTSVSLLPPQPEGNAEFVATFSYSITPATVKLGAYVAEVRFDPALIEFLSTDPALALSRIVNSTNGRSGALVAAGAAVDGFSDGLVFRGNFRALAPGITPANFQLIIREAADTRLERVLERAAD